MTSRARSRGYLGFALSPSSTRRQKCSANLRAHAMAVYRKDTTGSNSIK